jgi:hypothetical protein
MSGPFVMSRKAQHELSTYSIKFFYRHLSALIIGRISSPLRGGLTARMAVSGASIVLTKFFLALTNLYYFD